MSKTPSEHEAIARQAWSEMQQFVAQHDPLPRLRDELGLGRGRGRIRVLILLAAGARSPHEIAAATGFEPPYVTQIIDQLQRLDLLQRTEHPTDGRRTLLTLTPSGYEAAQRAEDIIAQPPTLLFELPSADLQSLTVLLAQLRR